MSTAIVTKYDGAYSMNTVKVNEYRLHNRVRDLHATITVITVESEDVDNM